MVTSVTKRRYGAGGVVVGVHPPLRLGKTAEGCWARVGKVLGHASERVPNAAEV